MSQTIPKTQRQYHNDPKLSKRQVSDSADPEEQSDQDLHCLLFHLHIL